MNDVNAQFKEFFNVVIGVVEDHYATRFPTLTVKEITFTEGRKYFKIINGDSVYCFVNKQNGDILKAASWAAPAKHARGNIFDEDTGLAAVGPYGANYL